MTRALIITDLQNDFLPGGSLEVSKSAPIIEIINKLQSQFELVIATQDWHPQNHMSFASNHPGKKVFENMMINGLEQILWPDHCVQNSPGAEFTSLLNTARIEAIFRKGTDPSIDSYSTFYDNAHLKSTGLAGYLKEKKALDLYFSGLAADFCVYYSIKDALAEGFNCTVITDATCPIDQNHYLKITNELAKAGVHFVLSKNISSCSHPHHKHFSQKRNSGNLE